MSVKNIKKIRNPNTGDYFILLDSGDPFWHLLTASELESSFQDSRKSNAMQELKNQINTLQNTLIEQEEKLCYSQLNETQLKQQARILQLHKKALELKLSRFKKTIRLIQKWTCTTVGIMGIILFWSLIIP
tara:strand:- start:164 stop:556 length:393 start_codon:yes stop_codon:yes gene_type:complete